MKAIIYLRVSTNEQAVSGLGLEAQEAACRKLAAFHAAEDVLIFTDAGISGAMSIEERPGLRDALATVKKGDLFIVAKRDRIARDIMIAGAVEQVLRKRKAMLLSAAGEGSGASDEYDVSAEMQRLMFNVFAQIERTMIRSRTKAALQAKKQRGERCGQVPFGYKLATDGVMLQEEPTEQGTIALIHSLAVSLGRTAEIVRYLNEHNIQTRKGTSWHKTQIVRILARP